LILFTPSISRNTTSPLDENEGKMLSFWGRKAEMRRKTGFDGVETISLIVLGPMAKKKDPSVDSFHWFSRSQSSLPILRLNYGEKGILDEFHQLKRAARVARLKWLPVVRLYFRKW